MNFDDSPEAGWQVGSSGVGYDRGTGYQPFIGPLYLDENARQPTNLLAQLDPDGDGNSSTTTVFLRYDFTVQDPEAYERLELRMRYDDAFVAYLNGVEIARANFAGTPQWNSCAILGNHEAGDEFESFYVKASPGQTPPLRRGENVLAIFGINAQPNSPDFLIQPELVGLTQATPTAEVVISQAEVNPASQIQAEEFLELQNREDVAIDISGWSVRGDIEFQFSPGTVIPAGDRIYVAASIPAFLKRDAAPHGGQEHLVVGPWEGRLDNQGGILQLVDRAGNVRDQYTTQAKLSAGQQFLRPTELHYHPLGAGEATEFLELTNLSSGAEATPLDLSDLVLRAGPAEPFEFPSGIVLAPGESIVIAKDPETLRETHPDADRERIVGPYVGHFSNGGETIRLESQDMERIFEFTYDDNLSWPATADGRGPSLEPLDPLSDLSDPGNCARATESEDRRGSGCRAPPPAI